MRPRQQLTLTCSVTGIKPFFSHDSVDASMGTDRVGASMGAGRVGASMGAGRVGAMMGDMDGADGVVPGLRDGRPSAHSEQHSHSTGTGQSATSTVKLAKSHMPSGMLPVKLLLSNCPVSGFADPGT